MFGRSKRIGPTCRWQVRHTIFAISSHDASRAPVYQARHELNHNKETAATRGGARQKGEPNRPGQIQAIISSEVIPAAKPGLFRERKGLGICNRNAAFCYHRRSFCVAGLCDRVRTQAIFGGPRKLSASKKAWCNCDRSDTRCCLENANSAHSGAA